MSPSVSPSFWFIWGSTWFRRFILLFAFDGTRVGGSLWLLKFLVWEATLLCSEPRPGSGVVASDNAHQTRPHRCQCLRLYGLRPCWYDDVQCDSDSTQPSPSGVWDRGTVAAFPGVSRAIRTPLPGQLELVTVSTALLHHTHPCVCHVPLALGPLLDVVQVLSDRLSWPYRVRGIRNDLVAQPSVPWSTDGA